MTSTADTRRAIAEGRLIKLGEGSLPPLRFGTLEDFYWRLERTAPKYFDQKTVRHFGTRKSSILLAGRFTIISNKDQYSTTREYRILYLTEKGLNTVNDSAELSLFKTQKAAKAAVIEILKGTRTLY